MNEFGAFCLNNKNMINMLMRQNTSGPNSILDKKTIIRYMPNLLDFENKRDIFKKELRDLKASHGSSRRETLRVHRENLFHTTFEMITQKSTKELRPKFYIVFDGERGIDETGLLREFFLKISHAMFDPNFALFAKTDNGVTDHPNFKSNTHPEHLEYFRFCGRIVGKAIYDE